MLRRQDIVHLRDGRGDCYLGPPQAFDRRFRLTWPHGARQVGDELQAFVTHHDAMAALRRLYSRHCDGGSRTWRMSDWDVVAALRHELSCGRLVMICGRPTVPEIARRGGSLAASLQDLAHLAGATPAAPAGPVSGWSLEQRIERVLRLTQDKLPGHMRAEFAELISPVSIGITIGIIAVWAASHGTPVGPAVDILLLLIGIVALGWGVFEAASALYDFIAAIVGANSERDLDRAAQHLARAIALLGVAAFAALLRKIGRTGGGGRTMKTKSASPGAGTAPPPPIKVGRVAPPSRGQTKAPEPDANRPGRSGRDQDDRGPETTRKQALSQQGNYRPTHAAVDGDDFDPRLPSRESGQPTHGVIDVDNEEVFLKSGIHGPGARWYDPNQPAINQAATHVEGHATALMVENGITDMTVTINNRRGPCGSCQAQIPDLLPEGSVLNVQWMRKDGTIRTLPIVGRAPAGQ